MKQLLPVESRLGRSAKVALPGKSIVSGLVAGLLGTLVMDLFGAGLFLLLGGPASLSFSVIGDAAAAFFLRIGIALSGGNPLGAALHYLIGLALGVLFSQIRLPSDASRLKRVGLAVVYVELMSLPMLAAAAILLAMTASQTAQWFGISFVMHLIYGVVLGAVVHGRLPSRAARGQR